MTRSRDVISQTSKDRFVDDEIMLDNRDTGERCSDNLSIARQKDETGRLKVQTIKRHSWTHRGYHGYPDPAVSH